MPPKSRSKRATTSQKRKGRDEAESEHEDYDTSTAEDDVQALDSDNLDDDGGAAKRGKKAVEKRKKSASPNKPTKRRKKAKADEDEDESELELKEGQEVVGKIVRAPKTGQGEFRMFNTEASRVGISHSPSRPDLSEHIQLSGPTEETRMQRSGMVSLWSMTYLVRLINSAHHRCSRFKLHGSFLGIPLSICNSDLIQFWKNPCSGKPRKNGTHLSKFSRTTSSRQTHRSHTCLRGT